YLAVWSGEGLRAMRLDASGAELDSETPLTISAKGANLAAVAWDGAQYSVAWLDTTSGTAELAAARVTTLGEVHDLEGTRFGLDFAPEKLGMASDGHGSLIVWSGASVKAVLF